MDTLLNRIDWTILALSAKTQPWTVFIDVVLDDPLDEARLHEAVGRLVVRHPTMSARLDLAGAPSWRCGVFTPVDLILVASDHGPADVVRRALLAGPWEPTMYPSIRFGLSDDDDGAHLMFGVNHLLGDGVALLTAGLELLAIVEGHDPGPPVAHVEDALDNLTWRPGDTARALVRVGSLLARRPTRLPDRGGTLDHGLTVTFRDELPMETMTGTKPPSRTELLVAAMHLTLGSIVDPDARFSVGVPADLRRLLPPGAAQGLGNAVGTVSVTSSHGTRSDSGRLLASVASQLERERQPERLAATVALLARAARVGNRASFAARASPEPKDRTGGWVDAAVLSNLGTIPDFGLPMRGVSGVGPATDVVNVTTGVFRGNRSFTCRHPGGDAAAQHALDVFLDHYERLARGTANESS